MLTSHTIVTLVVALTLFSEINIIGAQKHGLHFFSLFLPPGTSIALAFLLVPIELISFVFKPISLSIRLFANMMAGHTLLKVIAGFGYTLMDFGKYHYFFIIFSFFPFASFDLIVCAKIRGSFNSDICL